VGAMVPQAAAVQPVPDRDQVTPLFALSLATVAVNDWLCPVCTDEVAGDTVTETGAGGAGCCVDEPPQPASHATVNITNEIPEVRPTSACVNADLPSSYFRSSQIPISEAESLVYVQIVSRPSFHAHRDSVSGTTAKGRIERLQEKRRRARSRPNHPGVLPFRGLFVLVFPRSTKLPRGGKLFIHKLLPTVRILEAAYT
jgi:hypothetical protein